jgi:hypothetical protein
LSDLERAYAALDGKQARYDQLWDYYDGDQPLVYSAARLREIFRNINAHFAENWCAVVIDAMLDRIHLDGFAVTGDTTATEALNSLFERTELHLDSFDAHLAALVTGEAFVIAWKEAEEVTAYYNDPMLCHAFYDADNPRLLKWAAKWWVGDDGRRYLTLYYPDRLEYYVSRGKAGETSAASAFAAAEPPMAPNPFSALPVFHLRRERRAVRSELTNVIEPQNAINKLFADMMIAAEFGAMRQRWIISQNDPGDQQNAPNVNWWIPAGDGVGQGSQVGQFEQTDLGNYLKAMEQLANTIAVISRTPKHYFAQQSGDPSGEALITMEAPLIKKCERFIKVLTPTWTAIGAFLMQLAGQPVAPEAIVPQFGEVRTVQPLTQAQIRQADVATGIPLVTELRREGWTEAELAQLAKDQAAEQTTQADLGGALLAAFDRNAPVTVGAGAQLKQGG